MSEGIEIQFETDAVAFERRVLPFLVEREAENCLPIGIVARLANDQREGKLDPAAVMCAIERGGCITAMAYMTPPHNFVLTRMDAEESSVLAAKLKVRGVNLPGAMGPSEASEAFAQAWMRMNGGKLRKGKGLLIYQLERVRPHSFPTVFFRPGKPADLDVLASFYAAFAAEIGEHEPDSRAIADRAVAAGTIFVWHDAGAGGIVSMAACARPTPNGITVNRVYTPSHLRRRGYASAAVAALSQRMLDSGKKFCFLFTDAANPTSNHIYQKIGYEQVCECQEWKFVDSHPVRIASIKEIIPLRHEILRKGLPVETARFAGDESPEARHAGVFDGGGRCLACGTLSCEGYEGKRAYRLRGMAVAENHRRRGLGAAVLRFLEEEARKEGGRLLWCNARTPAVAFYEKYGWRTVGEEFVIETAGPHFRMVKELE